MKRYTIKPWENRVGRVELDMPESPDGEWVHLEDVHAHFAPLVRLVERLLPLFEERAGAWERQEDQTGRPFPRPQEITLTARFAVADLRAAMEVLKP